MKINTQKPKAKSALKMARNRRIFRGNRSTKRVAATCSLSSASRLADKDPPDDQVNDHFLSPIRGIVKQIPGHDRIEGYQGGGKSKNSDESLLHPIPSFYDLIHSVTSSDESG
jgi:hypothetical protein